MSLSSQRDTMGNIERWSAAKCARIHDRLRETVAGQSDDPEHLLDVLIAAWDEMHREVREREGAVEALREIKAQLARIGSPAEREDGAARAFVTTCEALDRLGGQ